MLLSRLHRTLEPVFIVLSGVWVVLVVIELATGDLPRSLALLVWVIWALFVVEFAVGLLIAPSRRTFLRRNWLTGLSLFVPALRLVRISALARLLGAARVTRSLGFLRVLTSVNRGLGALGRTARRRGVPYVLAATAIVLALGAGGMAYFEGSIPLSRDTADLARPGLEAYADALWWTAYTMTTGAPTIPRTGEGRLLGWLLSIYGLAVFGYLTAILASHFVGRDLSPRPSRPVVTADANADRPPDGRSAA